MPVDKDRMVEIWKGVLSDDTACWVVFKFGTAVVSKEPVDDPGEYALEILREWGPVAAGTPLGDFNVSDIEEGKSWLVTYPPESIMNYVSSEEIEEGEAYRMLVGLIGRSKRHADFEAQEIIHVEKHH